MAAALLRAQQDTPGFHLGANAGAMYVIGASEAGALPVGGTFGLTGQYLFYSGNKLEVNMNLAAVSNMVLRTNIKSTIVLPTRTIERFTLSSISAFRSAEFSFMFTPKFLELKGFNLSIGAGALTTYRTVGTFASEDRSINTQIALGENPVLDEREFLERNIRVEGSVDASVLSAQRNWSAVGKLRVARTLKNGPTIYVALDQDLSRRFRDDFLVLAGELSIVSLGFQYFFL